MEFESKVVGGAESRGGQCRGVLVIVKDKGCTMGVKGTWVG